MKAGRAASARTDLVFPAQNVVGGVTIGLLTLLAQIVLRRELGPGEFGTLNALLGLTLILAAPLAAFALVLRRALPGRETGLLLNRAATAWGMACIVLLIVLLPALQLPRLSLQFYSVLATGAALFAICGPTALAPHRRAFVGIGAAVVRLLVGAWCGTAWPLAESGLGALVLGCAVAGLAALRDQPRPPAWREAWGALRPQLRFGLAAIGLATAFALFGNADRIAAHLGFTTRSNVLVDYSRFDEYESAGLLARYLLWALLPLLLLFYRQRAALAKTTYASLRFLWIYLGALVVVVFVLAGGGGMERLLFGGPPDLFLPGFAGAILVLGVLQGVGVFALASGRHVECLVLAAGSIAYTVAAFFAGSPLLLPSCLTGGALITLALTLLVGVIRYARAHP